MRAGPLAALVAWWRGDISFVEAQRIGLAIEGPKAFTRAFPKWFDLYPFAHIGPAVGAAKASRADCNDDGRIVTLRIVRLGEPRDPQEGIGSAGPASAAQRSQGTRSRVRIISR